MSLGGSRVWRSLCPRQWPALPFSEGNLENSGFPGLHPSGARGHVRAPVVGEALDAGPQVGQGGGRDSKQAGARHQPSREASSGQRVSRQVRTGDLSWGELVGARGVTAGQTGVGAGAVGPAARPLLVLWGQHKLSVC